MLIGCKDKGTGIDAPEVVSTSPSNAVNIILSGGARARNIFWQVAGEVTIGTTSHFEGIILSMTGITLNTGATLNARVLAQTAAIFDSNTVNQL